MEATNLGPLGHTIHSRQSFHIVMMTEIAEELKLELEIEIAPASGYGDEGKE